MTATAADIEGIAAADRNVAGAGWTFMSAVDGSWGGTSEALSAPVTAPATAGTYAVCVRATDNADKMAKSLTMQYNRARQSQITTELSEIMGGVEAMKG